MCRIIMDNASDAILLSTADGRIFEANCRAEALLGYTKHELIQMHMKDIHPQAEHAILENSLSEMSAMNGSLHECLVICKNGNIVNVEVSGTGIKYQNGLIVMGIYRDITARKYTEENRLADIRTKRDSLVREVHHRIKNNLQGVVGLLRRQAIKHQELRGSFETAISQVNAMAVVHGLHGRHTSNYVILCDMVTAICRATGNIFGKPTNPSVTVEVESPIRVIDDEAVSLALILNELIFNAVKHESGGRQPAQVHVQTKQDEAVVSILTPAVRLPETFDFHLDQGLGTGLQLVKSLLPADGCKLRLENTSMGVLAELRLSPPVIWTSAHS